MSVDITEHYKLALRQHNHAADHRAKIINGWCLIAAGLAIAFLKVEDYKKGIEWMVTLVGIFATRFMWYLDIRTRDGLRDWRRIGGDIEKTLPKKQWYFKEVSANPSSPKHGDLIDNAVLSIVISLAVATICLLWKQDNTPLKVVITLVTLVTVYFCWEKWEINRKQMQEIWEKIYWRTIIIFVFLGESWALGYLVVQPNNILWVAISIVATFFLLIVFDVIAMFIAAPALNKEIPQRAYYIWENQDKPQGKDGENWLQAEKEIKYSRFCFPFLLKIFKK